MSSLTHLLAAGVFLLLTIILVRRAWGSPLAVAGISVFGLGSLFMLSMSGVYHSLSPSAGRDVLQHLDKASIFALVAATFTPAHLLLFRGKARWLPLALIWAAATSGIVLLTLFVDSVPNVAIVCCYLVMGWVGVVSGTRLGRRQGFAAISPLLWGGLAYSGGALVLFLRWVHPVPGILEDHELWHMAVLVGLSFHWRFVWSIVPSEAGGAPIAHGVPQVASAGATAG